jgi:hypothetical protein
MTMTHRLRHRFLRSGAKRDPRWVYIKRPFIVSAAN